MIAIAAHKARSVRIFRTFLWPFLDAVRQVQGNELRGKAHTHTITNAFEKITR